ncbi:MAG: DUF4293 family protein [Bacteroidetes bacterium]|nr:DUF4293 family protein [Bacteroidota bacterium]
MIQRIQTVWLLLAGIAVLGTLKLPFYTGLLTDQRFGPLNSLSHFLLLALAIGIALICFVSIFLFRNRKLQMQLGVAAVLLCIAHLIFIYTQTAQFSEGGLHLLSVVYFAIPVFLLLAIRGIYRDEQLVKDMNRLR